MQVFRFTPCSVLPRFTLMISTHAHSNNSVSQQSCLKMLLVFASSHQSSLAQHAWPTAPSTCSPCSTTSSLAHRRRPGWLQLDCKVLSSRSEETAAKPSAPNRRASGRSSLSTPTTPLFAEGQETPLRRRKSALPTRIGQLLATSRSGLQLTIVGVPAFAIHVHGRCIRT